MTEFIYSHSIRFVFILEVSCVSEIFPIFDKKIVVINLMFLISIK